MLGYFCVGPYVNLTMFGTALLPSIGFPILGVTLMLLTVLIPAWFKALSVVFASYTILILYLTA